MVPWTHLREPPLWGKCLTDLTSEFTHFNLVIRLSKVQQMALLLSTVFEESRCPGSPRDPSARLFHVQLCGTSQTSFLQQPFSDFAS